MNLKKYLPITKTSHGIAWVVWALFFANSIKYFFTPYLKPATNIEQQDWINLLIYSLLIASVLEVGVTLLIRYFALLRPFKKGSYNPNKSFVRFFIVGLINWFCSNCIVLYGPIIYYISGFLWPHFVFSFIGFVLLFYHSPRLKPFSGTSISKNVTDVIDTSWSKL